MVDRNLLIVWTNLVVVWTTLNPVTMKSQGHLSTKFFAPNNTDKVYHPRTTSSVDIRRTKVSLEERLAIQDRLLVRSLEERLGAVTGKSKRDKMTVHRLQVTVTDYDLERKLFEGEWNLCVLIFHSKFPQRTCPGNASAGWVNDKIVGPKETGWRKKQFIRREDPRISAAGQPSGMPVPLNAMGKGRGVRD